MKLTEKPKLRTLWIALAVVVGLLAVTSGSYAAYNSQDVQRGVARNRNTDAIRFTSNYLKPSSSDSEDKYPGKIIGFSKNTAADTTLTIDIYVYNYVVGSNSQVNEKDITYNMSIRLTGGTKESYKVKYENETLNGGTNNKYVKNNVTLTGRTANQHHYTVEIPGADLDKVKIIAKAEPVNKSYTGNKFLAAVIAPCTASTVQSFSCTGTFTDSGSGVPADYDAFNYEVSISGGKADVTLKWNKTLVEIDPFFLKKIGKTKKDLNTENNTTSLTYTMDQTKGTGDYLIPFYRRSKSDALPTDWAGMKDVISVTGKQVISTN